jgi:hypothetical protein
MLYQLSYASGAVAAIGSLGKIGSGPRTVKAGALEQLTRDRFEHKRKGSLEKERKETFPHAFPDCLFPREQGVTGMNPTAFPASLTGRIWFFCRTTDHNYCIFGLL